MIEFITYQGKKYPMRVSYYVLMMAQKESGVLLEELDKNFESQQLVLWYALEAGHRMTNKTVTLKREDMVWVLDECYIDFQKAIYQFAKSLIDMQQEVIKEDKKK
jgi:hypothetical protein